MSFWDQFFPGFLATLAGVALGIPAGLLIERLSHGQAERQKQHAAQAELQNALQILRESVERNRAALEELATVLEAGWVRPDTDLSVASWVATQRDVLSGLGDNTAMRAALASFFEGIERLIALNRLLVDQNTGVNLAIPRSKDVAGQIREEMKRRCTSLLDEAYRLANELSVNAAAPKDR